VTVGAYLASGLVLRHFESDRRQIEDLAPFPTARFHIIQWPVAMGALVWEMQSNMIWFSNLPQRVAVMSLLPSDRSITLRTQALGFWFGFSILGGRFVAVLAVLVEAVLKKSHLVFEFLDPLVFFGNLFTEVLKEAENSLVTCVVSG